MSSRPKIDVSNLERFALYVRGHFRCVYCHCTVIPFAHTSNPRAATLDHVDCYSHGGSDTADNLVVACASCNSARCDKRLNDWLWYLGWIARKAEQPCQWDRKAEQSKIVKHARSLRRNINNQRRRKLNLTLSAELRTIYRNAITHSLEGCVS